MVILQIAMVAGVMLVNGLGVAGNNSSAPEYQLPQDIGTSPVLVAAAAAAAAAAELPKMMLSDPTCGRWAGWPPWP